MEDIKLNSTVFHWPEHIATVFELAQARLLNRRENAEDELKRKVAQFEEKLEFYSKDIEAFRKKEVSQARRFLRSLLCVHLFNDLIYAEHMFFFCLVCFCSCLKMMI